MIETRETPPYCAQIAAMILANQGIQQVDGTLRRSGSTHPTRCRELLASAIRSLPAARLAMRAATQQTVFVLSIVFQFAILWLRSYCILCSPRCTLCRSTTSESKLQEPVEIAAKRHDEAALPTTMLPVPSVILPRLKELFHWLRLCMDLVLG